MEQLYIDGKPITYEKTELYSGEEAKIHRYSETELIKVFNKDRRANIPPIQPEMYQLLSHIPAKQFYLPIHLAYNRLNEFRAYTMLEFQNKEKSTHAQRANISTLMPYIERIEQDVDLLSEQKIRITDMKLSHILYNAETNELGIIDCGTYQKDDTNTLALENLKQINYYLRQALLWADYEGTKHEMLGIDFPEIYDELDSGSMKFSEVLKEEVPKYNVTTLEELKHEYQKMKFY